jgi:ethanolamine utilization protein EutM
MISYGYIEVVGLVPAVIAADAALKAASVEIVGKQNTGAAMIAVIMRGEIGAVRSAIEAAETAVEPIGKIVNVQIIAKPEEAISIMYK